jgi:pimeloyl-ACP methyl ester carboxylesterase
MIRQFIGWRMFSALVIGCAFLGASLERSDAAGPSIPASPAKVLPFPGTVFQVGGHDAFLIAPERAAGGGSSTAPRGGRAWVWYTPTLPGLPGPEERWMFQRFLDAGIAIAGVDAGESYGSPDGNRVFDAFFREVTGHRGLTPRAVFLARSRGGLMAFSWASEHPRSVAGIAGIYPVCNLASYPGLVKGAPAYHLEPEALQRHLARYNPIDRLRPLARARVPLFLLHGDIDTLVPLEANSGELASRYRALKGPVDLQIAHGQGHNMWTGFFECGPLVEFVIRNATAGAR